MIDLELWLDESDKRRIVGSRVDGQWVVRLTTHGVVAPGTLYVEGKGRKLADAIEDALDELERLQKLHAATQATVSP